MSSAEIASGGARALPQTSEVGIMLVNWCEQHGIAYTTIHLSAYAYRRGVVSRNRRGQAVSQLHELLLPRRCIFLSSSLQITELGFQLYFILYACVVDVCYCQCPP